MRFRYIVCILPLLAAAQAPPVDHSNMPGMDHSQMPGMDHSHMHAGGMSRTEMFLMNQASGTSINPESWPMPMFMKQAGSWHTMLMANAFLVDTQQSGPRGGD